MQNQQTRLKNQLITLDERIKAKKEKLLELLGKKKMNITAACKGVNLTRQTYYEYYNHDPEFRKRADELAESRIDYVESKLMELIAERNPAAIFFFLKCLAKSRGYIERQEVSVSGDVRHFHQIEQNLTNLQDTQLLEIKRIIDGECVEVKKIEAPLDNEDESC